MHQALVGRIACRAKFGGPCGREATRSIHTRMPKQLANLARAYDASARGDARRTIGNGCESCEDLRATIRKYFADESANDRSRKKREAMARCVVQIVA